MGLFNRKTPAERTDWKPSRAMPPAPSPAPAPALVPPPMPDLRPALIHLPDAIEALQRALQSWNRRQFEQHLASARGFLELVDQDLANSKAEASDA